MDEVLLKGLVFEGRHGVTSEEKSLPQAFEIDLVLGLDLKPAGVADCLDHTVDYSEVYQEIRNIVEQESFNLLEALAQRLADRVLNFPRVVRVGVTVKKLHPPIAGRYQYFGVRLERERPINRAFIGLGTNLGHREANLALAHRKLARLPSSRITGSSSVYSTLPWGLTDQPEFLNQVIAIDTYLSARELLTEMLEIENSMGRERTRRWGPRTIDLDLLLYGDHIIEEPDLVVPHPRLAASCRDGYWIAPVSSTNCPVDSGLMS